jgi:hypothetical protein
LLQKLPKLQKEEARLRSHGLALSISCDPRTTRVFAFHGSASLHLLGTQNARTRGIIIVKGNFELSDICDKEFHKMAQTFGMIAEYGQLKGKNRHGDRSGYKATQRKQSR